MSTGGETRADGGLGGGVAAAGELLLDPARAAFARLAAPFYQRQLREIRVGLLGADAGIVGAASLLLRRPVTPR